MLIQIQGSFGESNSATSLCLYEGYNNSCKTLSKIRAFGSMRRKESQGSSYTCWVKKALKITLLAGYCTASVEHSWMLFNLEILYLVIFTEKKKSNQKTNPADYSMCLLLLCCVCCVAVQTPAGRWCGAGGREWARALGLCVLVAVRLEPKEW